MEKAKLVSPVVCVTGTIEQQRHWGHIRSYNGHDFVAKAVQEWIGAVGAKVAYIIPASPWDNG